MFSKNIFPMEVRAEFSTENSPRWEMTDTGEMLHALSKRVTELEQREQKQTGSGAGSGTRSRRDRRREERIAARRGEDLPKTDNPQSAPEAAQPPSHRPARTASKQRTTKETSVEVEMSLDGSGRVAISTGLPFFDHMLAQLGRHGGLDLSIKARGDLEIDAHHTVEDTGIVLGECLAEALGNKVGVRRFASASVPLDEALVDVSVDLSGRAFLHYEVEPPGEKILGDPPFDPQLLEEFWRAFATGATLTLHVVLVRGRNTHHILESSFKGVARSLRDAVRIESDSLPSTKGAL